ACGAPSRALPNATLSATTQPTAATTNLDNAAYFSYMEPQSAIARLHEQLRIALLRIERLRRAGSKHLVGAHSLAHHFDERVARHGQHVVLRLQVRTRLQRTVARDDCGVCAVKIDERFRGSDQTTEPPPAGVIRDRVLPDGHD